MRSDILQRYSQAIATQGHRCGPFHGDLSDDWKKKPHDFCVATTCEDCGGVLRLRRVYAQKGKVIPEGDLHMTACPVR